MKALIYQGKGKKMLEERPKTTIQNQSDAIVKINKTSKTQAIKIIISMQS